MTILKPQTRIYYYKRAFLWDRDAYILEACRGKKILHIGATDWPNTREKFQDGSLLHTKIMKVAQEVLGIDMSDEGIEILKESWISNIVNKNINIPLSIDFSPDVILFGETIEHVMNMQTIFDGLKTLMTESTKLIISTPNSQYSVISALALLGKEMVHYDHNVIFSMGTLSQLIEKNGLKIDDYFFTYISRASNGLAFRSMHFLSKLIGYILPWKGETLLFVTSLANGKK